MTDYFSNLPNELLEKILINFNKYDIRTLLNLIKVCKKMYNYFKNNCRSLIIDLILSKRITENLMIVIKENIFFNSKLINYEYLKKKLLKNMINNFFTNDIITTIILYENHLKKNIYGSNYKNKVERFIKNDCYYDEKDDDDDEIEFIPKFLINFLQENQLILMNHTDDVQWSITISMITDRIRNCIIEFPNSIINNYYEYHNIIKPK